MTLSMALSILFLAAMIWILINPFTLEYQQERAAEMIDKGMRVKLVEHWWGWTVKEIKPLADGKTSTTFNEGMQ